MGAGTFLVLTALCADVAAAVDGEDWVSQEKLLPVPGHST